MVVARMPASCTPVRCAGAPDVALLRYLTSEIPSPRMTERLPGPDRQPHPRRPQAPRADPAAAGRARSAPARARSTGSRRATRTSPWRCSPASARRSTPRSSRSAPGPTHLRVTGPDHAVRLDRRQDLQERRRRAAVRLAAQPGPYDAAQGRPDRGGQPAARGARAASACRPAGSTTTTTSRSSRPSDLDLSRIDEAAARRTRSMHHVPRPAAAPRRRLRAALRRRLRPRHPHRRAAHDGAAALRPRGQGDRRAATTPRVNRAIEPDAADRAHRARRHRHRERPDGRRAAPRHHRHPQRRRPTTWSRTCASSCRSSASTVEGIGTTTLTVTGCAEIDVDVDYAPSEDPIEAMSLLAAAIVTESEITIRRVPIEFLEIELALLEEMGFQLRPLRGVRRRATATPGWSTSPPSRRRCTRRSTRSTRCRSPASTSTTCRSSRSSRPSPRARRCCTTGSTRTARSTSPSSTSSAARSSCSTRTG